MKPFLFLLLLVWFALPALSADIYKWRDQAGHQRYTDQLPPLTAKEVQKLKSGSAGLSAEKLAIAAQPFETSQAAGKYPVALFSFDECGDACKNAESFLGKRGIPYALKNKDEDKTELKQLTGGLQAPVLIVGKEIRKGFEPESWGKLLDAAGYAKENPYAKPGKIKPAVESPATSAPEAQAGK